MMRIFLSIFSRIGILFVLASGAYWAASSLMYSLNDYRSPLSDAPPKPGEPLREPGAPPVTRRVVIVLIDALRVDTASDRQVMPFLDELRQQSAWATMHSQPPSYSESSYTVLLTGAWPDISDGHTINAEYDDIRMFTQEDLFSAAHRAGLKTAISGYYWFEKLVPQNAVDFSFYTPGDDAAADRQVVSAALPWLATGDAQLVLVHLDQVDHAGHYEGGPRDPRWDTAARRTDDLLREIATEIDLRQDTLLVVSDHGQIDPGGHGGPEAVVLSEPFVLAGAGVRPGHYAGINMVDVAPTLAALLGASLPASSQGQVRSEMLFLPEDLLSKLPAAIEKQQSQLSRLYMEQIGSRVQIESGEDVIAAHQAAMQAVRQTRLVKERLLRLPVVLIAATLPLIWLLRKPRKEIAWLVAGSFVYLLVFNLKYILVDKKTYSLSSVVSQDELILQSVITAALAILVTWFIYFLGQRLFRQTPAQAVVLSLDLILGVIYLLFLVYLVNYAWNGALVTWRLPDFLTSFLGFFSALQILFVAIAGLLLTGLSGGISWVAGRQKNR